MHFNFVSHKCVYVVAFVVDCNFWFMLILNIGGMLEYYCGLLIVSTPAKWSLRSILRNLL